MRHKLKKLIYLINFIFISLSITSTQAYSAHDILNSNIHNILFSTQFNDHHDEIDHVHKHRHSENEEEHAHKHLNLTSSAEIIVNKIVNIQFHPMEIHSIVHFTYNIKPYDSYFLEILKPPIYA